MKRFIAIALIGMFSLMMVGTVYASFDKSATIELKKSFDDVSLVGIMDGVTPSVKPQYGKMVTVLSESDLESGVNTEVVPVGNAPPL